jgi:DNA/RNA-binding domain of Phe-tRNA-synthetase-like protein
VSSRRLEVDPSVVARVPAYRVVALAVRELSPPDESRLRRRIEGLLGAGRSLLPPGEAPLRDVPALRAWSAAYRAVGLDDRSFPPSILALARRLRNDAIPNVLPLVDLYNAHALAAMVAIGADDDDRVAFPIAVRPSAGGEPVPSIDGTEGATEAGEIVLADRARVLCRRWVWRQSAATALGDDTQAAVLTISSAGEADVETAADALGVDLSVLFGALVERLPVEMGSRPRADQSSPGD